MAEIATSFLIDLNTLHVINLNLFTFFHLAKSHNMIIQLVAI